MLSVALVGCVAGCLPGLRPTPAPIPSIHLVQRAPQSPCTAVLLPGIFDSASSFRRHGFARHAAELAPGLDVVAVDAHVGYYRKKLVLERLHQDVVGPLQDRGSRVWLVGTSLGGVGSLLYARGLDRGRAIPGSGRIEGLVLLAPFLGEDELLDDIESAGGPLRWRPAATGESHTVAQPVDEDRDTVARDVWSWLIDWHRRDAADRPRIVLAWGEDDEFARSGHMAATLLPPDDAFAQPGDHDWDTWRRLWRRVLESGVFDGCRAET